MVQLGPNAKLLFPNYHQSAMELTDQKVLRAEILLYPILPPIKLLLLKSSQLALLMVQMVQLEPNAKLLFPNYSQSAMELTDQKELLAENLLCLIPPPGKLFPKSSLLASLSDQMVQLVQNAKLLPKETSQSAMELMDLKELLAKRPEI